MKKNTKQKIFFIFFSTFVILFSFFSFAQEESLNKYIEEGKSFEEEGRFAEAIKAYSKAIRSAPSSPIAAIAYFRRGNIYLNRQKNYSAAIADFSKAIKLDSQNSQYYYCRGKAYFMKRRWAAALRDFDKITEIDPEYLSGEPYYARGYIYWKIRDYGQAIANFTKAIEINPSRSKYYIDRGAVYFDIYNYKAANRDWLKARELNPDFQERKLIEENLKIVSRYINVSRKYTTDKSKNRKVSWTEQQYKDRNRDASANLLSDEKISDLFSKWSDLIIEAISSIREDNAPVAFQSLKESIMRAEELKGVLDDSGMPLDFAEIMENLSLSLKDYLEFRVLMDKLERHAKTMPDNLSTKYFLLEAVKKARRHLDNSSNYLEKAGGIAQKTASFREIYSPFVEELRSMIAESRENNALLINKLEKIIAEKDAMQDLKNEWAFYLKKAQETIENKDFFSVAIYISTATETITQIGQLVGQGNAVQKEIEAMKKITAIYNDLNNTYQMMEEKHLDNREKIKQWLLQSYKHIKKIEKEIDDSIIIEISNILKEELNKLKW